METVGIFEAKTKLSQICKHVAQTKEPVLITIRGVPLVRIDPIVNKENDKLGIWEIRRDFIQKNGQLEQDFDLPLRSKELFLNPLDD
ncbi:unnamed protein product [marine sediment metagenome]|uniref:Antitoxin n=1 Tax=marine sediment metagenome TaxID=412755 RepID=X1AA54_9ZZZZ